MKRIRLYGRGGQGIVTASHILATAAGSVEGRYAHAVPEFGGERRGAPVYAFVRIDDQPIRLKSLVYDCDCVILMDMAVLEMGVDITRGTTPETILVVNSPLEPEEISIPGGQFGKIGAVDAFGLSVPGPSPVPNAPMIGAFAATTNWVGIEEVRRAVAEIIKGKRGQDNAQAAQRAYEQTRIR